MSDRHWRLPLDRLHRSAATAGRLTFVGGAGDFDALGRIRHPAALDAQIVGAMENLAATLALERCTLDDIVRLKAFYQSDGTRNEWEILAALNRAFRESPSPALTANPVPLQPFEGQTIQIQAIAVRDWRDDPVVRCVTEDVPSAHRDLFDRPEVTRGLRAGELIAVSGRTATDADDRTHSADGIKQTHDVMRRLVETIEPLGASLQDAIKMEGYYFGTSLDDWAPMATARAGYFREPGPVATVVPCHALYPDGSLTKVEILAMREQRHGVDKYIPREDRWPGRLWDWPIPVPYRQGIRLRETIWIGGQVAFEPRLNLGKPVLAGELLPQARLAMSYLEDIVRAFGA